MLGADGNRIEDAKAPGAFRFGMARAHVMPQKYRVFKYQGYVLSCRCEGMLH